MSASQAEQGAELTARLYECRTTLKFLHGESYAVTVQGWQELLLETWSPSVSLVMHTVETARQHNDIGVTLWLMAALVELLEAKES